MRWITPLPSPSSWLLPLVALCFLSLAPQVGWAADFESVEYEVAKYTVKRVDPAKTKLHLFLQDEDGKHFKRFETLDAALAKKDLRLNWAMNAGMYHGSFAPVGLFVSEKKEIAPLNLFEGFYGNFFLRPNGVFAIKDGKAMVLESVAYGKAAIAADLATQSGPMLVIEGEIHPKFSPTSTSKLFRNGVGVSSKGEAVFVISEEPVTFHQFARLFRDHLDCMNALFLDGTVSSLRARELKRSDFRMDLGPIIGEVEKIEPGGP